MLFRSAELEAIRAGTVDLAFRRWKRPALKPGTRLRTAIGVVEIGDVACIDPHAISREDARRAGAGDRDALVSRLEAHRDGAVYRIALRYAGEDRRVALRDALPSADELARIGSRLARFDAASRHGPWTMAVLASIADNEGIRAADLAARLGRDTLPFKADVRKLKELGLTESLDVGYRLSPRGRAVLAFVAAGPSPSGQPG